MSEGTATTTSGVSGNKLEEFEVCGMVATLGLQNQAIKGGEEQEGYVMVATDAVTVDFNKTAIRNGLPAQIPAKTGNNPEKEGSKEEEPVNDKDDNTRN